MNDRDFDNLFNKKLDDIRESDFAFNNAAWDNVENHLDKAGILLPPQSRWRKFLPMVLILALLGSNVLLSWKYYMTDQEATLLKKEVHTLKAALTEVEDEITILNDKKASTFFKKEEKNTPPAVEKKREQTKIVEKIVYVPQVIYVNDGNLLMDKISFDRNKLSYNLPLLKHSRLEKTFNSSFNRLGDNMDLANKWSQSLDFIIPTDMDLSQVLSDNDVFDENDNIAGVDSLNFIKKEIEATDKITNTFLKNKPIKLLDYTLDSLSNVKEAEVIEANKNTFADYLFIIGEGLTPNQYELGIYGSGILGYSSDYITHSRTGVGIVGGFRFSENIRLSLGVNWNHTLYSLEDIETKNYSDEFFADFPNMTPFYPDDQLHKLEGKLQSLEMPVEVEYTFGSAQKSWRPFIGGGIIARYHYRQTFEYYFLQAPDYLMDYNTGYQNTTFEEFGVSAWTAKAGIEYNINRHWLTRGTFTYASDFEANGFDQRTFQQFGVRLSMMYRF